MTYIPSPEEADEIIEAIRGRLEPSDLDDWRAEIAEDPSQKSWWTNIVSTMLPKGLWFDVENVAEVLLT